MTINSKLTLANTDTETIDSLVVSASQDAGGYSMLPSIRTVPVSGHLKQKLNF